MFGDEYFARAEIPAGDIAATLGLRRRVIRDSEVPTHLQDPTVRAALAGRQGTWTVFDGMYYQRLPEFGTWGMPDTDVAALWLGGQRLADTGAQVSSEIAVPSGLHPIVVLLEGERDRLPQLMVRSRWFRGTAVPLKALTPPEPTTGHGLRGRLYANAQWTGDPVQVVDAALPTVTKPPPPVPYSAVWDGFLHVDRAGEYVLGAAMDNGGSVEIDGRPLFDNKGAYAEAHVALDTGKHAIAVKYYDTGEGAYLSLLWIPPGAKETVEAGQWVAHNFAPLREELLFQLPFAGSGLRARYFANSRLEGEPFLSTVEAGRWLSHHQGNDFSVELAGRLYFPTAGDYQLGLNSDDGSWLYLDGALVIDNGGIHGFSPVLKRVHVTQG